MATEESRFARWSRMKLEAQEKEASGEVGGDAAGPEEDAAIASETVGEGALAADAGRGDAADSTDGEMPVPEDLVDLDIETLEPGYDFSRFLKDDVPDILRRRGLRQLWRSNSILANLDGMNEYDEDYTDAAVGVTAMKDFFTQTMAKREKLKAAAARAEGALSGEAEDDAIAADAGQPALDDEPPREEVAVYADNNDAGVEDARIETGETEGDGTSSLRLDGEGLAGADGTEPEQQVAERCEKTAGLDDELMQDEQEGAEVDRLTVLASRGWLPI